MKEKKKAPVYPKAYEGLSQYRPPLNYDLVGKTFKLVLDSGYDYVLTFTDEKALAFGKAEEEAKSYAYDCLKADDKIYFVNFEMVGAKPRTGMSFVLDLEQDLTTCVVAHEGLNPKLPRLPSIDIIFGAIERADGTLNDLRHGYTAEMVGMCIHWYYATLDVIHIYSSEKYYRLALPKDRIDAMRAAGEDTSALDAGQFFEEPSSYVKIKDGVYLFSFVEELMARSGRTGNSMLFVMNLNRMHDVGRSFGYNGEGKQENYTFGAFGVPEENELLNKPSISWIR